MKNAVRLSLLTLAVFLFSSSQIKADICFTYGNANNGLNNFFDWTTGGFYSVEFNCWVPDNSVTITDIFVDLQAGGGTGVFDMDQTSGGSFAGFFAGSTGLAATDVTFTPAFGAIVSSATLDIDFAPGSFAAGDVLLFNADTDGGGAINGSKFWSEGVTWTITLSDGTMSTLAFTDNSAVAGFPQSISCFGEVCPIPEPGSAILILGFGLVVVSRRRKLTL